MDVGLCGPWGSSATVQLKLTRVNDHRLKEYGVANGPSDIYFQAKYSSSTRNQFGTPTDEFNQ